MKHAFKLNASSPAQACSNSLRCLFLAIVCFLITGGQDSLCAEPIEDPQQVKAIAVEYLANRNSFDHYYCEYELRWFKSDDRDGIFNGRIDPAQSVNCSIARDDQLVHREIQVEDKTLKSSQEGETDIAFVPMAQLLEGDRGLYYTRAIREGVLYSSAYPSKEKVMQPFTMGAISYPLGKGNLNLVLDRDPSSMTLNILSDPAPDEPYAAVPLSKLIRIEIVDHSYRKEVLRHFYVSPDHGYLPIIAMRYVDGILGDSAVVTEVREVEGGRFYPIRNISMKHHPDHPEQIYEAIETRVTKLEVDQPIAPDVFQIEIPAGSVIRDGADDHSQFRFGPAPVVTVADFDELFRRAKEQSNN